MLVYLGRRRRGRHVTVATTIAAVAAVEPPARSYKAVGSKALAYFEYPSPRRAERVLGVAGAMRNTLHNNGFHAGSTFSTQVNGHLYRFRTGTRFSQGGWGHIIQIVRAELRLFERLLALPKCRSMPYVPEPFAEYVLGI